MVEHNIEHHGDAVPVRRIDKGFEIIRCTVSTRTAKRRHIPSRLPPTSGNISIMVMPVSK